MKILIIGGMHGNEPLGIELVEKILFQPIAGVDALCANIRAIEAQKRFVKADLNRSFPGDANSKDYETQRSDELLKFCKKYDLVLDFHNTYCPNNDCSFLGENANELLYDLSSWLGLRRIIVADYECINKYALNCLSVEISLSSSKMGVEYWYERINKLSKLSFLPKADKIERYEFVYRITLEDKKRLQLQKYDLEAFKPIDSTLAKAMRVKPPVYPIFVNDKYTPYNYGGLVSRIDV
jgi:hypothetical protein